MKVEQYRKLNHRSYIVEGEKSFQTPIYNLEVKKKVYIDGLWQSEKYFKDVEHVIREDLEFFGPFSSEAIRMASKIQEVNSISLHGRSYFEVPPADSGSPFNMDYYSNAADLIAQKIDNPHFFCFSDNPDWLKANLRINYPLTFVNSNPVSVEDNTISDLWLMSRCKHHIIANSTFSWWGAWLNKSPEKIVIAPACEWQNPDYIPNGWIVL
jgi:hypothetical protein